MKVLIVSSAVNGRISPFVQEQVDSLQSLGIKCQIFAIRNGGIKGYISHLGAFRKARKEFNPDIIHAHYGLSGLFSNIQRKIPVVTTYHGSDLHQDKNRKFSRMSVRLSASNIYVTNTLKKLAKDTSGYVIPCGVDTDIFHAQSKDKSKERLRLDLDKRYVLFGSAFDNWIKNSRLAKEAVSIYNNNSSTRLELLELKGMSREEVSLAINASEMVLLTSFNEGSPQVIKEALSCNAPIVSTAVGSVPEMLQNVEGCFVVNDSVSSVVKGIHLVLDFLKLHPHTAGRERIASSGLSLHDTAQKINHIYQSTHK